jgi:hypothetical protein
MKRIMLLFLWGGLLTACNYQSNNLIQVTMSATNTILPSNINSELFQVVTSPNPTNELNTDVYIQNVSTNEKTLFITLDNVYRDHYHVGEYHNGNLYIIRRMGYPGDNWSDELWRYDPQGNGTKLISRRGLDFRVASDGNSIAVGYPTTEDNSNRIAFISNNGEVIQEINIDPTGNYLDQLDKWTDDNSRFWGELQLGPTPKYIYQITTTSWDVKKYDVSQLSIGDEFELNANTGKIVFSDYPVFFDVDSKEQFINSGKEIHLFLYDLNSQTSQIIATSITKQFSPQWLDNNSIEYKDPDSETRITFKIN